jgi:hypothetical protein
MKKSAIEEFEKENQEKSKEKKKISKKLQKLIKQLNAKLQIPEKIENKEIWNKLKYPNHFYDPLKKRKNSSKFENKANTAKDLYFVTLNKRSLQIWLFSNNSLKLTQYFEINHKNKEELSTICLFDFNIKEERIYDFLIGTTFGNIYFFVDNDFLLLKNKAHSKEIQLMETLKLYSYVILFF